jgi:hypothetical protein
VVQDMPQDGSTMSRQVPLRAVVFYDGQPPMIAAARVFTGTFLEEALSKGVAVVQ